MAGYRKPRRSIVPHLVTRYYRRKMRGREKLPTPWNRSSRPAPITGNFGDKPAIWARRWRYLNRPYVGSRTYIPEDVARKRVLRTYSRAVDYWVGRRQQAWNQYLAKVNKLPPAIRRRMLKRIPPKAPGLANYRQRLQRGLGLTSRPGMRQTGRG